MTVRLVRIGNSRGVRIPQKVLEHYRIREGASLELEERQEGILIRISAGPRSMLTWEQAYQELAHETTETSEWAEWDTLAGDGIDG